MCVLPGQANEVFKEVKHIVDHRIQQVKHNPKLSPPLIVSCLAAIGTPKLKLMLTPQTTFIRTKINVAVVQHYLKLTKTNVPNTSSHPA